MKRFSIVNNGYNIEEVNNFIDIVIKKLEKLSDDNKNYLNQLENLKNNTNQNIDERVSKALIAATETTERMKELAKEEADLIIREAKDNASAIVQEALVDAQKKEEEFIKVKKDFEVYKAKMKSILEAELELLKSDEEKDKI